MSEPTQSPNDFEIAAKVVDALKDVSKPRQTLILKWVSESLGLSQTPPPPPTPPADLKPPLAPPGPASSTPAGQLVDIASFVASKQPKTDIQFVATVAHYYRFVAPESERLASINTEVAQNATRLADWDRLANPRSTLNNAKNQGYLDSAGHGEFAINTVGENLVARSLPTGEQVGSKKTKAAKVKKSKGR